MTGKRRWIPILAPAAIVAGAVAWVKRPARPHELPDLDVYYDLSILDGADSVTYAPAPGEDQAAYLEPPVLRGGILHPRPHERHAFSRIGPKGPLLDPDPDAGPTGPMGR